MVGNQAHHCLLRLGWRRTGLLGSTEWVETHADLLKKNAVVYINSDGNGRGFFGVSGSHTIEKFINEVSRDVIDPEKKIPVSDRARARQILNGSPEARREARERSDLRIGALGSGSDYTAFLDHIGVASLNLGYGGEGQTGGVYHSVYDSFDHYTRFGDPNFAYGVALAQTGGRAVLRFANADVLPYAFGNFADSVGNYVREVGRLADDMRDETKEKNRRVSDKTFVAVFDPMETYVVPTADAPVPFLNFAPLQNALAHLQESAQKYDAAWRVHSGSLTAQTQQALDEALMQTERAMIREAGLPRRPWFKHQIYAPGFYTGYGVKTLPAIREAIEQRNWTEAEQQINLVADTLNQIGAAIDRATAQLR